MSRKSSRRAWPGMCTLVGAQMPGSTHCIPFPAAPHSYGLHMLCIHLMTLVLKVHWLRWYYYLKRQCSLLQ